MEKTWFITIFFFIMITFFCYCFGVVWVQFNVICMLPYQLEQHVIYSRFLDKLMAALLARICSLCLSNAERDSWKLPNATICCMAIEQLQWSRCRFSAAFKDIQTVVRDGWMPRLIYQSRASALSQEFKMLTATLQSNSSLY